MINVLKHRDFNLLWGGFFVSSLGDQMQQVAEEWLVFVLTNSPFLLGVVGACQIPSRIFLAPVIGVLVDRSRNRKRIMIAVALFQLVLALTYGILITANLIRFWHILILATLNGMVNPLIRITRQTVVPNLVPREDLFSAISLYSVGNQASQVAGPLMGGLIIAWRGIDGVCYINALSFLGVIIGVAIMRLPEIEPESKNAKISQEISEGMRFVRSQRLVFYVMAMQFVSFMFALPFQRLLPVYAKDILNIGPTGLGVLRGAIAAGSVLGGLGLVALGDVAWKNRILNVAGTGIMLSIILFSHSTVLYYSVACLAVFGMSSMVYRSTALSVIHLNVPDQFRGRVMGLYNLEAGFRSLGNLVYGSVASLAGTPRAVGFGGATFGVLAFLVAHWSRRVRKRELGN